MGHARTRSSRSETPLVEWIVAAIGAAIVVAVIAFLVYRAVTTPDTPASIRVETQAARATTAGFLVPFVAVNDGEQSAAHVVVEGRLQDQRGATIDRAEATLDYVPAHSTARGGLYFRIDPRSGPLVVRALGYARP